MAAYEITGLGVLAGFLYGFFDCLLDAIHGFGDGPGDFHLFGYLFVEVVDAGDVGEEVEGQFGIVAEEVGDFGRGARIEQQRVLAGWGGGGNELHSRSGYGGLNGRFDFLDGLQWVSSSGIPGCRWSILRFTNVPQGLKPAIFLGFFGTAKA